MYSRHMSNIRPNSTFMLNINGRKKKEKKVDDKIVLIYISKKGIIVIMYSVYIHLKKQVQLWTCVRENG